MKIAVVPIKQCRWYFSEIIDIVQQQKTCTHAMNLKLSKLNTELKLFCPRPNCPCYQSLDNIIAKDGVYTTKNDEIARQMFYCTKGKHRFSETGYCDLFGKHGSFKEYEQMCKPSCYGVSTEAIADVLGKDPRNCNVATGCKQENLYIS